MSGDFRSYRMLDLLESHKAKAAEFNERLQIYEQDPNPTIEAEMEYRHAELADIAKSLEFLKEA